MLELGGISAIALVFFSICLGVRSYIIAMMIACVLLTAFGAGIFCITALFLHACTMSILLSAAKRTCNYLSPSRKITSRYSILLLLLVLAEACALGIYSWQSLSEASADQPANSSDLHLPYILLLPMLFLVFISSVKARSAHHRGQSNE